MRDVYRAVLLELAQCDPRIFCLDSDVGGLESGFGASLPQQYVDVGIAEANLMSIAAGLAKAGKIPFVNTFAAFASCRSCEQVKIDIALHRLPVKLVCTHAGLSAGHLGVTHHSMEDVAIMRALPNMTVLVPCDAAETEKAVRASIALDSPAYIRLGRKATAMNHRADFDFRIGRAAVLREGGDLAVFACGPHAVRIALEAAAILERDAIRVRVLNMHTIKPLDVAEVVRASEEIGRIVTIEEHSVVGGLGSAVAEVAAEHRPCPVIRIGSRDCFAQRVGDEAALLRHLGISVDALLLGARAALSRGPPGH